MRSRFERAFESILWNSRFVVVLAVLGSTVAALTLWLTRASGQAGPTGRGKGKSGKQNGSAPPTIEDNRARHPTERVIHNH